MDAAIKNVKLSDVNVKDITVKEMADFMRELRSELPFVSNIISRMEVNEVEQAITKALRRSSNIKY